MSDEQKLGTGKYVVAALLLIALVGNCQGPASAQVMKPYDPQAERLEAENLVRVKKLCKARPDCVEEMLTAEEQLDEIMLRLQMPQARWHSTRWVRLPPPVEVTEKVAKIRSGLRHIRVSNMVEVNGRFVLDSRTALYQAKETIWHYWIDLDSECWIVGEDVPGTNFYACYDYGQRTLMEKTDAAK
jgi:hypothetical protein